MAPKTAMKAMKTATKGPKSVKPTRATAAKGKSKNAKDKSNKSVTDELKVYNFKNSVGNHTSVLGRSAKVNFFYERNMPCTKTPEQLKDLVATILPSLQAIASASNAQQVSAFFAETKEKEKK